MDVELQSPREASSPEALRLCGFCHKPFLKGSSYDRHVLYCRQAKNRPRSRIRSCRACKKAKRKCNGQARCQRCTHNGFECVYDIATTSYAAAMAARESMPIVDTKKSQPAQNGTPLAGAHIADSLDQFCASSGTPGAGSARTGMNWDCLDFSDTDMLLQNFNLNVPSCSHLDSALNDMSGAPSFNQDNHQVDDCLVSNSENWPLPRQLSRPVTQDLPHGDMSALTGPTHINERPYSDFLAPVPIKDPVSQFTANVVMQMLCAFPQMMLRRETFPPFIHGHWSSALPKPLTDCMGLAQIFASHNVETRSFLWRTVREEQQSSAEKVRFSTKQFYH
jgi:Fungal Zn(2)-Cys(6) binuclear cluster domain